MTSNPIKIHPWSTTEEVFSGINYKIYQIYQIFTDEIHFPLNYYW